MQDVSLSFIMPRDQIARVELYSDVALSAKKHVNLTVKLLAICMTNFTFVRNQEVGKIEFGFHDLQCKLLNLHRSLRTVSLLLPYNFYLHDGFHFMHWYLYL